MNFQARTVRGAAVLFALPLLAAEARAQHALYAEDHGVASLVVAARGFDPCVERNGEVVQIAGKGFLLQPVPEYLPIFVRISEPTARVSALNSSGNLINNDLSFSATLESGYPLKDVFIVLDMKTERRGEFILLAEIGQLEPNSSRPIALYLPLEAPIGPFSYRVHIFSGGEEVFQSRIPLSTRQAALNKMVAKRIKGVQNAAPTLFIGPAPVYPPAFVRDGLTGRVVLSLMIAANGEISSAVIKSATNPEFAKAATFALQDWRFLPRVKDGHPVESRADVPFVFSPPHERRPTP